MHSLGIGLWLSKAHSRPYQWLIPRCVFTLECQQLVQVRAHGVISAITHTRADIEKKTMQSGAV